MELGKERRAEACGCRNCRDQEQSSHPGDHGRPFEGVRERPRESRLECPCQPAVMSTRDRRRAREKCVTERRSDDDSNRKRCDERDNVGKGQRRQQPSLDSGEAEDREASDVLIERGVDVWRLIVHFRGGDPICVIELREDSATIEDDWGHRLATINGE